MRAAVPASLAEDCDSPADIVGDGPLSAGEVERMWAQDRAALITCKAKHGAVVTFYRKRDAGLARKR